MKSIRVVLAIELPTLCEAVKRILNEEPEVEIVAEVMEPLDLLVVVGSTRANMIIQTWPESGEMPGICTHLLGEYPELRIIGVPSHADRNAAHRIYVCQQQVTVQTSGLEDLLAEIRRPLQENAVAVT